jgi:hypothetical protein
VKISRRSIVIGLLLQIQLEIHSKTRTRVPIPLMMQVLSMQNLSSGLTLAPMKTPCPFNLRAGGSKIAGQLSVIGHGEGEGGHTGCGMNM